MSLAPGSRIGGYEVLALVGAGGMGEVYRARDTRLQRDVAIKILPPLFAGDPDRLARFEREAQTLAALNHPHIAQIHGVEGNALVMEYVDGEDLAQRIARGGRLPLDEALAIGRQIADALAAAHERGVVHRDLKPANIKVREDGTVKVLDFGLAKLNAPEGTSAISNSPTFTSPALMTHAGIIIGTAAYMSPEQAKGKTVDRRADLWALGVVIYEMLTGRAAFDGETITDVLAAVVTRDPDWNALPADTPISVRRLLLRCVTRDPRRRLADAGEAAYQLEEAALAPPASGASRARDSEPHRSRALLWRALPWAALVVVAIGAGVIAWRQSRVAAAPELRYSIETPQKTTLNLVGRPAVAISPDGTMVAFVASSGGPTSIYLRRQNEFDSRSLPGTEGASEPAFSPDGRWLAFYASNKLNKVPVYGGSVEALADVNDPRGLSWDAPDGITFTPEPTGGVFRVSPSHAAPPQQVTTIAGKSERTHRWAQTLPNGALLFTVGSLTSPDNYDGATIEAQRADGQRKVLVKGAAMARYVAPNILLFARNATLFAVPFDPDALEVNGTPSVILQSIAGDSTTGAMNFACSSNGTLAYIPGHADEQHRLAWVDRGGRIEPLDLQPAMYFDPKLSPDGRRAAVIVVGGNGGDVWVYDFMRKTFTRLTFGGSRRTPGWSRDGSTLYYGARATDRNLNQLVRKPADGSGEEEVITAVQGQLFIRDVLDDQQRVLADYSRNANKQDIGMLPFAKEAKYVPLVTTSFDDYSPSLSPDRRWIAYQSDETSRYEIYVRPASGTGGRWQISTEGGEEPRWSPDGRELYFRNDTRMMVARVEPGATFQNDAPRVLFDGIYNLRSESGVSYDVDAKGRFLMVRLAQDNAPASAVRMILNWTTALQRTMTGSR